MPVPHMEAQMLPKNPQPNVKRADGSLWEASFEVSANGASLWAVGLFDKQRSYCFRRLSPSPRPWWRFWAPKYVRTGEVWVGGDMSAGGFTASAAT